MSEAQLLARFFGPRAANVVQQLVSWFLENGLDTEGVFRQKADDRIVDSLKSRLDSGENVDLSAFKRTDGVHVIATLIKNYYKQLPEPLFPYELYDDIIAAQKSGARRTDLLKAALQRLSPQASAALQHLVRFLRTVSAHSATNFMPAANLAIVFAPNLLRPREESIVQIVQDANHINSALQSILEDPKLLGASVYVEPEWRVRTDPSSPPTRNGPPRRVGDDAPQSPTLAFTPSDSLHVTRMLTATVGFLWDSSSALTGDLVVVQQTKLNAYNDESARQIARISASFGPQSPAPQPIQQSPVLPAITPPTATAVPASAAAQPTQPFTPTQSFTPASSQPFDSAAFLRAAQESLKKERVAAGRPAELSRMISIQLKAEKSAIKRELRQYDSQFAALFGREPTKHDKEPMRPLYQRYKDVKQLLSAALAKPGVAAPAAPAAQSTRTAPTPTSDDPAEISAMHSQLKAEKRALQVKLTEFQKEFVRKTGRKVKYREDRLPMEEEYQRYKAIKSKMAELEAKMTG